MAFKSTKKNLVRVAYLGETFIFTLRHPHRSEIAAVRANQAEIKALEAAMESGDKSAVKELEKNTDLLPLAQTQTASLILDIQIEAEGGAIKPAPFDIEGSTEEKTWTQMDDAERLAEIQFSWALFSAMWNTAMGALGDFRILGK